MNTATLPTTAATFRVDDVELSSHRFSLYPVAEQMVREMGRKESIPVAAKEAEEGLSLWNERFTSCEPYALLGCSDAPNVLSRDERTGHPVLEAVHNAFSHHLPLVLSPDAIWLTVLQGVSMHIGQHAEAYRPFMVSFEGKRELIIVRPDLSPSDTAAIGRAVPSIVEDFSGAIDRNVTEAYAKVFAGRFSTTTPVIEAAARITAMEAFSPFFDYHMYCACGFPQITLTGEAADWRRLRAKVIEVEELFDLSPEINLTWWTSKVRVICDELVAAAEGSPNIQWWKRMYKLMHVYANHMFNGWIGWLWPYTKAGTTWDPTKQIWIQPPSPWRRNPMLEDIGDTIMVQEGHNGVVMAGDPVAKPFTFGDDNQRTYSAGWFNTFKGAPFMYTSDFPLGLAQAKLKITDMLADQSMDTLLVGGFVGVSQDDNSGALTPEIGYGLLA